MLTKQRKVVKTGHPAGHIGWTKYLQQGCSWIVIPCFDAMVQSLPLKAVLVAAGAIGFGHLFDPVLSFAFSPLSNFVSQPSCARSTFAAASRGESDICRYEHGCIVSLPMMTFHIHGYLMTSRPGKEVERIMYFACHDIACGRTQSGHTGRIACENL